jgi:hypothetical protein
MTTNLQEPQEFTGVEWVVDLQSEPPSRLVKIEFDTPTLIALVDVADAASYFGGERTRENAVLFKNYVLPIIRELESRSLVDYDQWVATKHLTEVDE